MSNYLQTLTAAKPLAPPAASDTAADLEQHVTVEVAPPARPFPSASPPPPPPPHAPSVAPDALQTGHDAPAAANLHEVIEEVVRWVQAPAPPRNTAGPPVQTSLNSVDAHDGPTDRATPNSDFSRQPRAAAANAQPAPHSQPAAPEAPPEERVMVETRSARTPSREDARPAPRVTATDRLGASSHADSPDTGAAISARPEHAVEVHIGSIALTVKAPPPPALPLPAHAALTAPLAPKREARPSDGQRFSASRHYLRWS